jgi:hypothetical protein
VQGFIFGNIQGRLPGLNIMSALNDLNEQPKRVVLRLRVNEFDGLGPDEFNYAIKAYLKSAGRPVQEIDQNQHFSDIEPFQAPELKQRTFHIVLDIDKDLVNDPDFKTLPHEAYRVRRGKDGKL